MRPLFDPHAADARGLCAIGGTLHPDLLVEAYRAGVFPWSSAPTITWWSPDPRAIFDLATWRPHRSLRKRIAQAGWRFSLNEAFESVIRACGTVTAERPSTWISSDFVASYVQLHHRGQAHSVEVWEGTELVGGLYGVALGGFFGGESMFHRRSDASKAAVAHLIDQLRRCQFTLLDAQVPNPHLERLGAIRIRRADYLERLEAALAVTASLE